MINRYLLRTSVAPSQPSPAFLVRNGIGLTLLQFARPNPDWIGAYLAEHAAVFSAFNEREDVNPIGGEI